MVLNHVYPNQTSVAPLHSSLHYDTIMYSYSRSSTLRSDSDFYAITDDYGDALYTTNHLGKPVRVIPRRALPHYGLNHATAALHHSIHNKWNGDVVQPDEDGIPRVQRGRGGRILTNGPYIQFYEKYQTPPTLPDDDERDAGNVWGGHRRRARSLVTDPYPDDDSVHGLQVSAMSLSDLGPERFRNARQRMNCKAHPPVRKAAQTQPAIAYIGEPVIITPNPFFDKYDKRLYIMANHHENGRWSSLEQEMTDLLETTMLPAFYRMMVLIFASHTAEDQHLARSYLDVRYEMDSSSFLLRTSS